MNIVIDRRKKKEDGQPIAPLQGKDEKGSDEKEEKKVQRRGENSGIHHYNICTIRKQGNFQNTPHQTMTVEAYLKSKYKGMLLYHKLGSGKTCTAILIADALLEAKRIERVFVFTPGSLRQSWYTEYCRMCGKEDLISKYIFITYNYSVEKWVNITDFSKSLVIIDEIHNVINGVKNGTKTAKAIYDNIIEANCKTLLLTGTPIITDIDDFRYIARLLDPNRYPIRHIVNKQYISEQFIKEENGTLKPLNPDRPQGLFGGLVSFYPGNLEDIPRVIELPPLRIKMSEAQEEEYWGKRMTELMFQSPPDEKTRDQDPQKYNLMQSLYIIMRKRILSRKASNFSSKNELMKKPDLLAEDGGWIDSTILSEGKLSLYSNKLIALIQVISTLKAQKHVVFSFFKTKGGVILIQSLLKKCGISSLIFSGDLNDRERASVLERFNNERNLGGKKYRVLLVTEAGAEGISVLDTNNMHIFESSPRIFKTMQAIGRVARFRSHARLPLKDRYVRVWRYWSVSGKNKPIVLTVKKDNKDIVKVIENPTQEKYVDEELYIEGMKSWNEIDSFLRFLQDSSVTDWE